MVLFPNIFYFLIGILFVFVIKPFHLRLRKPAGKSLKNHYIISNKTAINKDKNTDKKQVCNQQKISRL